MAEVGVALFENRKQRKELGLLLFGEGQLVDRARELKASGALTSEMSHEEVAVTLLNAQMRAYRGAYEAAVGINWDAILAFLEKLIPLILMLIGGL